ncbi:hypothetical protein [Streptomyces iconiensis]|uniref:hypothetical protein n=1 Tax=Streptomyces iconiensis TaxID=1384038 RepID=UPI003D2F7348
MTAAHHPRRVTSLALLCTSARFGEPQPWWERAVLEAPRTHLEPGGAAGAVPGAPTGAEGES